MIVVLFVVGYLAVGIGLARTVAPRILERWPGESDSDDNALYAGVTLLWPMLGLAVYAGVTLLWPMLGLAVLFAVLAWLFDHIGRAVRR